MASPDNDYIAMGLARYGRKREALKVIDGMLNSIVYFGFLFPEVFGGARIRIKLHFQSTIQHLAILKPWAAGAPLLFLRTLLGVTPSRAKQTLELDPIIADEPVRLEGVEAFGKSFTLSVGEGSGGPKVTLEGESRRSVLS